MSLLSLYYAREPIRVSHHLGGRELRFSTREGGRTTAPASPRAHHGRSERARLARRMIEWPHPEQAGRVGARAEGVPRVGPIGGLAPPPQSLEWRDGLGRAYSSPISLIMFSMHETSGRASPAGSSGASATCITLMVPLSTYMAERLQRFVWKPSALLGPSPLG